MSKYNHYAKKLDTTFRAAQEAYEAEVQKLAAAQAARDKAFAWSAEKAVGIEADLQAAQRHAATIALQAAQEQFNKAARKIVEGYRISVTAMKEEVAQAVSAANLVDPAAVDSNALALLNSGIMTSSDYEHMCETFRDNATMRRLIGKYAHDAAEAKRDDRRESEALRAVYAEAGKESYCISDTFNAIADASIRYIGASAPERSKYCTDMQAHWNDGDIREAIENF